MRPLTSFFLGVAALATISVAPLAQQAAYETRVDSLFSQYTRATSPGVAVAVVRDGKVLFSKGYGFADLEHRIPITSSTVFDLASVSKQFTGLAVAMLVEQGRVKLSDDIRKYIPEMRDVGQPITIDHLLHHTSGLRDWPGMLSLAGWRFDDVMSFDQILRFAYKQRTLNFAPGAEYSYSNTEYNLLAEMIHRVTGQSFSAWTTEHFFRPLGMASSHFQDDHTYIIPNRALGYNRRPDGSFAAVTNNLTALGSSSMFSSVDDMTKWVMNFDDARIGGASAIAMTRTRGVLNNGTTIPYAFGIVDGGVYRGLQNFNHSGGWASFSTFVLHFPAKHAGVIVLANGGGINASRAAYNVADIFFDADMNARTTVAQNGAPATTARVAPDVLNRYVGLYRLGPGWYVRIRRDGDVLKTQATTEAEFPMRAVSQTGFWVDGYNAPMMFETEADKLALRFRGRVVPKLEESRPLSPAQLAAYAGDYESSEIETRYRVEVKDGGLVMQHFRHGTITLTRLWNDDFTGSVWFTRSVEFQRDASGKVVGFLVRVDDRSRDVRFVKKP